MYALSQKSGRGWLIGGGIISVIVGIFALCSPVIFTEVITILIGAFCLVTGVISVFQAIFGKQQAHRVYSGLAGVIRIAAGIALLFLPGRGIVALTLVIGIVFLVEAVACVVAALGMRGNPSWLWLFLNGIIAGILGAMILSRWPSDALWLIGLLFGIQVLFSGLTMILIGLRGDPPAKAA